MNMTFKKLNLRMEYSEKKLSLLSLTLFSLSENVGFLLTHPDGQQRQAFVFVCTFKKTNSSTHHVFKKKITTPWRYNSHTITSHPFKVCLPFPCIIDLRQFHISMITSGSFFSMTLTHSTVWMYHDFIYSHTAGHHGGRQCSPDNEYPWTQVQISL